jgi:hypothetical protein
VNRENNGQSIKTIFRKRALIWLAVVIALHLLEGCRSNDQRATSLPPTPPAGAPAINGVAPVSYAEVVSRVAPAVVTIRSELSN